MNVIEQLDELQKTDQEIADAERRLQHEITAMRTTLVEGRAPANVTELLQKMEDTLNQLHMHRATILREVERLRRPVN